MQTMTLALMGTDKNAQRPRSAHTRHRSFPEPLEDENKPLGSSGNVTGELHRSASYTHFQPIRDVPEPVLSFSEADLLPSDQKWHHEDEYDHLDLETEEDGTAHPTYMPYILPTQGKNVETIPEVRAAAETQDVDVDDLLDIAPPMLYQKPKERYGKLTRTISTLTRKQGDLESTATVSRVRRDVSQPAILRPPTPPRGGSRSPTKQVAPGEGSMVRGLSRKLSILGRKARMAETARTKTANEVVTNHGGHTASLLSPSFSSTSLPTLARQDLKLHGIPPMPRNVSTEKLRVPFPHSPKKRDELWSVLHSLDGDFQKFQSKSSTLKANVVRSSLLPFLRAYATHPSNWHLQPEDLDRRCTILNKWWTGLLEMLSGRSGQGISGTDRPAILDGISGIMERPEWRSPPSILDRLSEQSNDKPTRPECKVSAPADASDILLESVLQNVRDIFVGNLLTQIILVVDKMSLKNAPASLVVFCGKSCAYAFMFCPSVADILVRLWDITPSVLRRVLDGFNVSKTANYQETSDRIRSTFPPCIRPLAFVSFRKSLQDLQMQTSLPPGTDQIQWHGYWVGRWSGKDSDLLYVFVKYYHLLIANFLPENATKTERACVPGFLLVHAQLLTNLESTLHWQSTQALPEPSFDPTLTFDDLLGPDASVSAIPAPSANATRLMAENRLILLLRDFLSEKNAEHFASWIFADDFCTVLVSAIRTTSLYDHNACFTLCDFLQEAFVILVRYEASTTLARPILESAFWIGVFTRMVDSHNTMTEIRLYAFLYTIWSTIMTHETWKTDLCFHFLLEETFFYTRFNHWCPMVRAYFMRLICWRIARADGDASESDISILTTLMARLNYCWSHYHYLALKANEKNLRHLRPSTVPCHPAPGRRLLIIRTDTPATSSFLLFNDANRVRTNKATAPAPIISAGPNPNQLIQKLTSGVDKSLDSSRRRSGLLRTFLSYRSSADARSEAQSSRLSSQSSTPDQSSTPSSRSSSPDRSRSSRVSMYESTAARSARTSQDPSAPPPLPPPRLSSTNSSDANASPGTSTPTPPYHGPAFFKFSLELVDRRPSGVPMELHPPRLPLAPQQLVQQAFQAAASTGGDGASRGSGPYRGPRRPVGPIEENSSRYTGRALAEWQLVVNECQNFFDRRRREGVPSYRLVETPTLSVESYRRPV